MPAMRAYDVRRNVVSLSVSTRLTQVKLNYSLNFTSMCVPHTDASHSGHLDNIKAGQIPFELKILAIIALHDALHGNQLLIACRQASSRVQLAGIFYFALTFIYVFNLCCTSHMFIYLLTGVTYQLIYK